MATTTHHKENHVANNDFIPVHLRPGANDFHSSANIVVAQVASEASELLARVAATGYTDSDYDYVVSYCEALSDIISAAYNDCPEYLPEESKCGALPGVVRDWVKANHEPGWDAE